jgi:hypothetical protein
MQSPKKSASNPDEVRFPTAKRFYVLCQISTFNKGQFNYSFVEGQMYEAYELIEGKDYIVWFGPDEWEAITGNTFKKYFSIPDHSSLLCR